MRWDSVVFAVAVWWSWVGNRAATLMSHHHCSIGWRPGSAVDSCRWTFVSLILTHCWRRWRGAVMRSGPSMTGRRGRRRLGSRADCCYLAWLTLAHRWVDVTGSTVHHPFECDRYCWHLVATAPPSIADARPSYCCQMARCCNSCCHSFGIVMAAAVATPAAIHQHMYSNGRWDAVWRPPPHRRSDWCSDSLRRCSRQSRPWICAIHLGPTVHPLRSDYVAWFAGISRSFLEYQPFPIWCVAPAIIDWKRKKNE